MTTELTILLTITAFVVVGIFVGPNSAPRKAFVEAGPSLGARIERQLDTGAGFQEAARNSRYKSFNWKGSKGDFEQ